MPGTIGMIPLIGLSSHHPTTTVGLSTSGAAVVLMSGGLFANVCYLAGPLVEVYARWLGFAPRWLRPALFTAGTLLTLGLAFVTIAAASF